MADYKKMYVIMVDAAEKAMELLVEAQRQCEALYIETEEASDRGGHKKNRRMAVLFHSYC